MGLANALMGIGRDFGSWIKHNWQYKLFVSALVFGVVVGLSVLVEQVSSTFAPLIMILVGFALGPAGLALYFELVDRGE